MTSTKKKHDRKLVGEKKKKVGGEGEIKSLTKVQCRIWITVQMNNSKENVFSIFF